MTDTSPAPTSAPASTQRRYFLRAANADGLFTGERLQDIDPARFSFLQELIADGRLSRRQIAKAAGVSPNTVRAIEDTRAGSIDALRAKLSTLCASIEASTLDRIREALEDDDPDHSLALRDLAAILREVGNRSDLLAGRPTAIIGHESGSVSDLADANAARRAILRRLQADAIPASFTEPPPLPQQMGFEGEIAPAREAGAPIRAQVQDKEKSSKEDCP